MEFLLKADSTHKRNLGSLGHSFKDGVWCFKAETFSRPVVQFILDSLNELVGQSTEVGFLGDVLADETVEILV